MSDNNERKGIGNISKEDKLLLIKLKIQKRVEKRIREPAGYFMVFLALMVMFGGTALAPPKTLWGMILVLIFCFVVVPIATTAVEFGLIRYYTNKEFEKFLEGEDLVER